MPKAKGDSRLFLLVVLVLLGLATVVVNFSTPKTSPPKEVLGEQTTLANEIAFWEEFVTENSTYIEGWVELASLLSEDGQDDYAEGAVNTARAINPNHKSVDGR